VIKNREVKEMKGKSWLVLLVMVCMLMGLSSQAQAWWGRERSRPAPEKVRKTIARRLELTEEQKKKFEAVEEETKKEMKASREKEKQIGEKLKAELQKDTPDRNAVHRHIQEMSKVRTRMEIKRMDSMLELREMLTAEQQEKFKKMLGSRRFKRKQKH
jgi:Spy/CpxP family protein refolding chaperone